MTGCAPCAFVRQVAINGLLITDMVANVVLGGKPGDTVSARLGRAEAAGSKAAHVVCRWLNVLGPKHCQQAADPDKPSVGAELWPWSPPE